MHKLLPILPMLVLLAWATVQDLRTRRIGNWLTLAMAAGGLLNSFLAPGAISPSQAGLGMLVGFILPFVLYAIGALGGGDVKLLAGVGSWIGPGPVVGVFVIAALVGLVIVLVQTAVRGRLFELFRNSAILAISLVHIGQLGARHAAETGKAFRSVDRPLPYALPVLAATLIVVATML